MVGMPASFSPERSTDRIPDEVAGRLAVAEGVRRGPESGASQADAENNPPNETPPAQLSAVEKVQNLQDFLREFDIAMQSQLTPKGLEARFFRGGEKLKGGRQRETVYQQALDKAYASGLTNPEQFAQEQAARYDQLLGQVQSIGQGTAAERFSAYKDLESFLPKQEPLEPKVIGLTDLKNAFVGGLKSLWGRAMVGRKEKSSGAPEVAPQPVKHEVRLTKERLRDRILDAEVLGLGAIQETRQDLSQIRQERDRAIDEIIHRPDLAATIEAELAAGRAKLPYRLSNQGAENAWNRLQRGEILQNLAEQLVDAREDFASRREALDAQLLSNARRRERITQLIDDLMAQTPNYTAKREIFGRKLSIEQQAAERLRTQRLNLEWQARSLELRQRQFQRQYDFRMERLARLEKEARQELAKLDAATSPGAAQADREPARPDWGRSLPPIPEDIQEQGGNNE